MLNIKNIINGWANLVKDQFDTLEPSIKEQAQLRFLNCERCHIRNGNVCSSNRKGINLNSGKLSPHTPPRITFSLFVKCLSISFMKGIIFSS